MNMGRLDVVNARKSLWLLDKDREKEIERSHKNVNKNTIVKTKVLNSSEFRQKFDMLTDDKKLNRIMYEKAKEMLKHRSGTKLEDLIFISGNTILEATNQQTELQAKPTKAMKKLLKESTPNTVIAMHNHPHSTPPSYSDIVVANNRGYRFGLVIGHDGTIYKYEIMGEVKTDETMYKIAIDKIEKEGYNENIRTMLKNLNIKMEVLSNE